MMKAGATAGKTRALSFVLCCCCTESSARPSTSWSESVENAEKLIDPKHLYIDHPAGTANVQRYLAASGFAIDLSLQSKEVVEQGAIFAPSVYYFEPNVAMTGSKSCPVFPTPAYAAFGIDVDAEPEDGDPYIGNGRRHSDVIDEHMATRQQGTLHNLQFDALIEGAGRECYDSFGVGRSAADFHRHIAEVGHGNVARHVNMTWRISGVSRALTHELIRHTAGVAVSQRSTRYVDEGDSCFVMPPLAIVYAEDSDRKANDKRILQVVLHRQHVEATRAYIAAFNVAMSVLDESGLDKTSARKIARGTVRSVLPMNLETSLYWTMNLQAFINTLFQRMNEAADIEICRLFACLLDAVRTRSRYLSVTMLPEVIRKDNLGTCLDLENCGFRKTPKF